MVNFKEFKLSDTIKDVVTGVKSLICIIGSIVGLTIFVYMGNHNAGVALAETKELRGDGYQLKSDVRSIKEASENTDKNVARLEKSFEKVLVEISDMKKYMMENANNK